MPQANPTAEPEAAALLPPGVSLLATRLTSTEPDPPTRFVGYLENLGTTLRSYDVLRLDAVGFACSASSYLVGAHREAAIVAELDARLGAPVITGGMAIRAALAALGLRRIAMIAPYPQVVVDAGAAYFTAAGHEVVVRHRVVTPEFGRRARGGPTARPVGRRGAADHRHWHAVAGCGRDARTRARHPRAVDEPLSRLGAVPGAGHRHAVGAASADQWLAGASPHALMAARRKRE
ncbi:MAG: hypothetical protein MUF07_18405 [Steroidobacteraceae bacterium]|nr:hypothetical protein [Steroidobacteraceae bacterium]